MEKSSNVILVDRVVNEPMPSPADLDILYSAVLDHLLFPPHVKEQLQSTQTAEKKWQTCLLHKNVIEDVTLRQNSTFGERDRQLLNTIRRSKRPDIKSLVTLKTMLSTANQPFMSAFMEAGGDNVLVKCVEDRLVHIPMTPLDATLLYEIISCLKSLINNVSGMGMLNDERYEASVSAILHRVAESLRFEWKPLALQVLEILSVCCYASEKCTEFVINGMRRLAKTRQEPAFYILIKALVEEDIEVKAGVMQFINNMIMGVGDLKSRLLLRSEFTSLLLDEKYRETEIIVNSEMEILQAHWDSWCDAEDTKAREGMVIIHGHKAKVDLQASNTFDPMRMRESFASTSSSSSSATSSATSFTVGTPANQVTVDPVKGIMAGQLMAAKNLQNDMKNRALNMFGAKKTKHRWYELNGEDFKWMSGHERVGDSWKGVVSMSSVLDIRFFTTEASINQATQFAFEFETNERVFSLGCDTLEEKECWIAALQQARDNAVMKKSSYCLTAHVLGPSEIQEYVGMFLKQGKVYQSLSEEDRQQIVSESGLDTNDPVAVASFLKYELIAQGKSLKLVQLMQELLLLPNRDAKVWDRIIQCASSLRRGDNIDDNGGIKMFTTVELLAQKEAEGGSAYKEVGKLAMALLSKDAEIAKLAEKVDKLELALKQNGGVGLRDISSYDIGTNVTASNTATAITATIQNPIMQTAPSDDMNSDQTFSPPTPAASFASSPSETSPTLDVRFEKFEKMKKSGIPEGAIRQKMSLEGISSSDTDAFFAGTLSAAATTTPAAVSVPTASLDPRFEKFEKMKKSGIPEGAIRQKMSLDGLSPSDIDNFFSAAVASPSPSSSSLSSSPPSSAPPLLSNIKFAKYEKMMKMLPEGAVRQKMMTDEISPAEIDTFFANMQSGGLAGGAPTSPVKKKEDTDSNLPPAGMQVKPKLKHAEDVKLKGIFWTKLKSDEVVGTVWHRAEDINLTIEEEKKLENWFGAKPSADSKSASAAASSSSPLSAILPVKNVSLFDGKRTQNVSIALGRLRMTPQQIVKLITDLDEHDLTLDHTRTLLAVCPTKEEMLSAFTYHQADALDAVGKFFSAMHTIPRVQVLLI